jgi:hypothetical protein
VELRFRLCIINVYTWRTDTQPCSKVFMQGNKGCEISGSYGVEYEDDSLLRYFAV